VISDDAEINLLKALPEEVLVKSGASLKLYW
jgi:hypothetical protein